MQSKTNVIISVLVLVFFIPASLGFALINHHCSGCQSHNQEAAFLLTAHVHDDAGCSCTESKTEAASCDCEQQAGSCHDDQSPVKHTHDCVVELKKLEEPFTPATFDNCLPAPLEISFAALFFADNRMPPESFSANSAPLLISPPTILTGYERLILNEVFRL